MAGSHLGPGALAVLGLTGLDEFIGGGQLGTQFFQVAGIGGEMIAGQAGFPRSQRLGGGSRQTPLGKILSVWRSSCTSS